MRRACLVTALGVAATLIGCGEPKLPPPTEVEGTLLLGGQPLPNATVTFTPTAQGLPSNSSATGVTDENGKFKLTTAGKPGAIPGEHIVTVVEGPAPENLRDEDAQEKLAKYQAKLKNRPIPTKYANTNSSDSRVTVTKDQKEYEIKLAR